MKEYYDKLLLRFLMFSKNIEDEIRDFEDALSAIEPTTIYELAKSIQIENIYTEENIANLKKVIEFLKSTLDQYSTVVKILNNAIPSYDIYYYSFMNKYDVLENEKESSYGEVSKKFLEDSIRFDFYAIHSLTVSSSIYVENFLNALIHNPMYPLFVHQLLVEYPDILFNKQVVKRITSILRYKIDESVHPEMNIPLARLLKKVDCFSKNRKMRVFDYAKFLYYKSKALIEFLITSDVDLEQYHDILLSGPFLEQLTRYIDISSSDSSFDEQMIQSLKSILNYIFQYKNDDQHKVIYNAAMYNVKLMHANGDFYEKEEGQKYSTPEILEGAKQSEYALNDLKASLYEDYRILDTYGLPEERFNDAISFISVDYYIMWFRKMYKLDKNFFYNDHLRRRTLDILEVLGRKSDRREIQRMKTKMIRMTKELAY